MLPVLYAIQDKLVLLTEPLQSMMLWNVNGSSRSADVIVRYECPVQRTSLSTSVSCDIGLYEAVRRVVGQHHDATVCVLNGHAHRDTVLPARQVSLSDSFTCITRRLGTEAAHSLISFKPSPAQLYRRCRRFGSISRNCLKYSAPAPIIYKNDEARIS